MVEIEATRLIRSRHPVHAIWAYTMENGPKPQAGGQNVLISRPEYDPAMTVLRDVATDEVLSGRIQLDPPRRKAARRPPTTATTDPLR